MTKSMTISRIAGKAVCYLVVVIIFVVAVFPFFHLLSSALRPYSELFARPPLLLPKTFTLEWFQKVLNYSKFFQYFRNSIITALGSTLLSVAIGCMAAYSITRGGYRGKNLFSKAILVAYMFPPIILVIPLFQIVNGIGLANTHFGLILTYITFSFPFSAWMLVSYFKTIPKDIEEAAKVDGASNLRVFTQIILPLAMPAVVTAATFTFINSWNEFLYAFVLANSDVTQTLPVALYSVKGGEMMEWGPVLASSAMLVVPSLIFFLCFSKHIVSGLTAGAVKG